MTQERFPESMAAEARQLIAALMQPEPAARASMAQVQAQPFFAGLDLDTLYSQTPPTLSQGIAPPAPHASWTRRQNSMMWSPLPQRYDFADDAHSLDAVPETALEADAPFVRGRSASALPPLHSLSEEGAPHMMAPPATVPSPLSR